VQYRLRLVDDPAHAELLLAGKPDVELRAPRVGHESGVGTGDVALRQRPDELGAGNPEAILRGPGLARERGLVLHLAEPLVGRGATGLAVPAAAIPGALSP
jgi:hypothetical protein